jgi:hypothetical protein
VGSALFKEVYETYNERKKCLKSHVFGFGLDAARM